MSARRIVLVLALVSLSCTRSSVQARRADEVDSGRVAWDRHVEVATGPAVRGPWRMNESDYRWVDDPAVDLAKDGDAVVAWVDQAGKDLFFQRYAASGEPRLPAPTNVSKNGGTFSWLPRIVADDADPQRVYVAWQEIVFSGGTHGGDIFFARTTDGGRTFDPPANLSSSKAGDGKGRLDEKTWDNGSLDLARSPEGHLFVVWTEYEGTLWLRRSTDNGATWTEAIRVGGATPARGPTIAAAKGGVVWIAWAVGEDPHSDIHVARSEDSGRSFNEVGTVGAAGHSDAPQLALDAEGNVHLVYAESPTGRGGAYSVHYARLKRGATSFEDARTIAPGGTAPTVSVDVRGRVYVLWERRSDKGGHRQGLGFSYSNDGGDHFVGRSDVPGIAGGDLGVNGSQQGMLADKLAVDDGGAIAVVNSTFEPGRISRVRLVRGRVSE